jgi:hypothetical protein
MQLEEVQTRIGELQGFLPLVYGTGGILVAAVVKALRFLGLEARSTQEGANIDILAKTSNGAKAFGIEVTGVSGPIRKDSPKLTQLEVFEREKGGGEKGILIANTYNSTPILDRSRLEDFTPPVLEYFKPRPVLLMTGWDLYRLVRNVLAKKREKQDVVELLYSTNGKFEYKD